MDTSLILVGVGIIAFIGYFIWLIVRAINWDSKVPPVIGMLLCVVMVVCGIASMGGSEDLTNPYAESKRQESQNTVDGTKKETHSDALYEITYQSSYIYRNVLGEIDCFALVEIENTSAEDLYLDRATFDFEDSSGKLLATVAQYSTIGYTPYIIAPGEKGYFYTNAASLEGEIDENTEYFFNPTIKVEKSKMEIIRYPITELSISEGNHAPYTIIGRVENNTEEDEGLLHVSCILYRSDGTPICVDGTNVLDFTVGSKASFEISNSFLSYLDIKLEDIDHYEVYACKLQYQF